MATLDYCCDMNITTGLLKFMAANNLTVSDLARQVDVDKAAISRISRGLAHPSMETIRRILEVCRAIDPTITFEDLFETVEGND